jgi:hypothetical protein
LSGNTDGPFTPIYPPGVGSNTLGYRWTGRRLRGRSRSLKPPEFNTIDFLVSAKKDSTGKDEVFNVYQEGQNMSGFKFIKI